MEDYLTQNNRIYFYLTQIYGIYGICFKKIHVIHVIRGFLGAHANLGGYIYNVWGTRHVFLSLTQISQIPQISQKALASLVLPPGEENLY